MTKKIRKSTLKKEINNIEDIDVNNIFLKKKRMVQKAHLNTLLDIMIIILLDNYVQNFHK